MSQFLDYFGTALLAGGISGAAVAFLLKTWIEARVKASIKHEYDKQLELFRGELEQKQKIALVSELLSEWIAIPRGDPIPMERRLRLNRLSFEASLWLPAELAAELSKTMQLRAGAKTIFDLLLMARKELTGDASLTPEHVTYWGSQFEKRGDTTIQRV